MLIFKLRKIRPVLLFVTNFALSNESLRKVHSLDLSSDTTFLKILELLFRKLWVSLEASEKYLWKKWKMQKSMFVDQIWEAKFCLCDVSEIPNTVQNVNILPFHSPSR